MTAWLRGLMLVGMVVATPAVAQEKGPDAQPIARRDRWLPPTVPTTDDVQRIPVPADFNLDIE